MKQPSTPPQNKSKRKRTRKQLEASRRNRSNSKGPLTEAGKAISARNATIHGLTAQKNLLLSNASAPALDLVRQRYFDRFQPADPVEAGLVYQMVSAQWRPRRYGGVETALLDEEMNHQRTTLPPPSYEGERCARAFKSLADDSNALALNGRYLSRLIRDYYRAMNALIELRAQIPAQPDSSPHPAVILPGLPGVHFPKQTQDRPNPFTLKCSGGNLERHGGPCWGLRLRTGRGTPRATHPRFLPKSLTRGYPRLALVANRQCPPLRLERIPFPL